MRRTTVVLPEPEPPATPMTIGVMWNAQGMLRRVRVRRSARFEVSEYSEGP